MCAYFTHWENDFVNIIEHLVNMWPNEMFDYSNKKIWFFLFTIPKAKESLHHIFNQMFGYVVVLIVSASMMRK